MGAGVVPAPQFHHDRAGGNALGNAVCICLEHLDFGIGQVIPGVEGISQPVSSVFSAREILTRPGM